MIALSIDKYYWQMAKDSYAAYFKKEIFFIHEEKRSVDNYGVVWLTAGSKNPIAETKRHESVAK